MADPGDSDRGPAKVQSTGPDEGDSVRAARLGNDPALGAPVSPQESPMRVGGVSNTKASTQIAENDSSATVDVANTSRSDLKGTTNPLFGATPDQTPVVANDTLPPPPITHLRNRPSRPGKPWSTGTLPLLRRLIYVSSLLLGTGALVSLIWSTFLLPLLHASFSARKALVEAQVQRVAQLLGRIKALRAMRVYVGVHQEVTEPEEVEEKPGSGQAGPITIVGDDVRGRLPPRGVHEEETRAMIREISSSSSASHPGPRARQSSLSASSDRPSSSSVSVSAPITWTASDPIIPDLDPLRLALRNLASARSNTSTTRTSLLSTIESYTGSLHRQLWDPRPGAAYRAQAAATGGSGSGLKLKKSTGYGLNSLDNALARASGGSGAGGSGIGGAGWTDGSRHGNASVYWDGFVGEGLVDRGAEWDAVRKEIRGIKGLLLGRRSLGMGST